MFKDLAGLAGMVRQAQQMMSGGHLEAMQQELAEARVTGTAGGGLVEVEASGKGELLRLQLDEELVAKADREMLEDLIPAAVNQALQKARELHVEQMQSLTQGMDVPGLQEAMSRFNGTPE